LGKNAKMSGFTKYHLSNQGVHPERSLVQAGVGSDPEITDFFIPISTFK
jgi:hypothetical protein